MCWACADSKCKDPETCSWRCKTCNHRLPGALGHGRPCNCPDTREGLAVALANQFGPEVAAAIIVATDKRTEPNVREQAFKDLGL